MDAREKRKLFIGMLGLIWLLVVLLAYATTHKSFSLSQIIVISKSLWQTVIVFGLISFAGGLGAKIISANEKESPLVWIAIQNALGFGILGLIILGMGASVGFSILNFGLLLVGGIILFRKEILLWWKQWTSLSLLWKRSSSLERKFAFGVLFILILRFLTALAPPLVFDSLVYHLTLPKHYLLAGGVAYTDDLIYWGMPQLIEMLYTFVMALAGVEAATLLGWGFGFLTLVGLLGYIERHFSSLAAWVAVVALLTGGSLTASLSSGYVEWALMLYGLSSFVLLKLWLSSKEAKFLYLLASFAGFLVGIKYTAAIFPVAIVFVFVFLNSGRGTKEIAKDIAVFGGLALLTFSPWMLKNFFATGNPVYPLLFPGGAMGEARIALHQEHPAWGNWQDLFLLPWRATVWGVKGKIGYSEDIGPLLLALSSFVGIGWKKREKAQKDIISIALIISLVFFSFWAISGRLSLLLLQSRLYFIFFPIWALLAGAGFERFYRLKASGIRFGRVSVVLLFLAFAFNVFTTATEFARYDVSDKLLGLSNSSVYRQKALGEYEIVMNYLEELPSDSHVLMLWETRSYACYPLCEPDEVIDRWYIDLKRYGSPDDVLEFWKESGYSHLLFRKEGADFVRNDPFERTEIDWAALDTLLADLPLLKDFNGQYQLYELRP
ncbi:MAG: hypothetical protein GY755_03630 [Chloroflexi bacterium]|nr:hypothetical protein [Chloroflexota bacterium]